MSCVLHRLQTLQVFSTRGQNWFRVTRGDASTGELRPGLSATYEAGAVSATVFTDESDDWGLEGSYAMGNGLTVYAGLVDAGEDYYVAGSYDLGGDATLLVSYVEDGDLDNGDDEIGDPEYQAGMTVEIGFTF